MVTSNDVEADTEVQHAELDEATHPAPGYSQSEDGENEPLGLIALGVVGGEIGEFDGVVGDEHAIGDGRSESPT
jgi:hypothetical protein